MSSTTDAPSVFDDSDRDRMVVVPDVCGDSEAVAHDRLRAVGLAAGQRLEEPSRSVAAGTVFGTVPRAGSMVAPGTRIAFVVATCRTDGDDLPDGAKWSLAADRDLMSADT